MVEHVRGIQSRDGVQQQARSWARPGLLGAGAQPSPARFPGAAASPSAWQARGPGTPGLAQQLRWLAGPAAAARIRAPGTGPAAPAWASAGSRGGAPYDTTYVYGSFASCIALRTASLGWNISGQASSPARKVPAA